MNKLEKKINFKICVKKTLKHIYCRVFSVMNNNNMIFRVSSLDKHLIICVNLLGIKNKIIISKLIGYILNKTIGGGNIHSVSFNQKQYKFHGRIKALTGALITNKY